MMTAVGARTHAPAGTSVTTKLCAPIRASSPTWIGPSSVAPTPSTTRSPTLGWRQVALPSAHQPRPPRVTWW